MSVSTFKVNNLAYLYWLTIQLAKRVGLAGLAGFGLLLICLAVYVMQVLPMRAALEASNHALLGKKATQNTTNALEARKPNVQLSSEKLIADTYAEFPSKASLSAVLKVLQQTALKHKLALIRGDYKFTQLPTNAGMARYEIQLPLSGQYLQLRSFVDEALDQVPTLGLSEMQLKRENSVAPLLEARVLFVLYLKDAP